MIDVKQTVPASGHMVISYNLLETVNKWLFMFLTFVLL